MRHLFLVISMFVLVSGFSDCEAELSQKSVVLDGLRPIVRLNDAEPFRWTLNERLVATNTPGIAIAVIDDFQVAWVHVAGFAEARTQRLVTDETLFHAKSISKPVTAYATLLLADRGTIDIETDITEYLQSWSLPDNEFTANYAITTAQVLSHSAGFTRWGVDSYKVGEDLPTLLESLNGEAPAKYKPINVNYIPGSKTRYSGGGYGVLQQMLIDVSGVGFASLMHEYVFLPLNMEQSHFPQPMAADLEPLASAGHDSSGRIIDGKRETLPIMAAGGLWSSADDLALFVIEVMKAWSGKSELMSRSMARKMLSRRLDDRGLGFQIDQTDGLLRFSHTGSGDGFKALIVGEPASGKGLVVLANSDSAGVLRKEILRSVADTYQWMTRRPEVARHTIDLASGELGQYTGDYMFESGTTWTIAMRNKQLSIDDSFGGGWTNLYPDSISRFFTLSNTDYQFILDAQGAVTGLSFADGDDTYKASKVD